MALTRLTVSIPAKLAQQVRRAAGPKGLSAFVTNSLRRELSETRRRQALEEYLEVMETRYGPLDPDEVAEARQLFHL